MARQSRRMARGRGRVASGPRRTFTGRDGMAADERSATPDGAGAAEHQPRTSR